MNKELINEYKRILKKLSMQIKEFKQYRKALERDINKLFIRSYTEAEMDCDYCLPPNGHGDTKDSNYTTYMYLSKKALMKAYKNALKNDLPELGGITRDLVRYRDLKLSLRSVNLTIDYNKDVYSRYEKEYKELLKGVNNE